MFFNRLKANKAEVPSELSKIINDFILENEKNIANQKSDGMLFSLSGSDSSDDEDEINEITKEVESPPQENPFNTLLFSIIDEKGFKDSFVYKKAYIDRRVFSKIRSSNDYHPSKGTIIQLALALELSLAETEKLLDSAGYSLPKNSKENLVIIYLFEHKIFDVKKANNIFYTICRKSFNQLYL